MQDNRVMLMEWFLSHIYRTQPLTGEKLKGVYVPDTLFFQ